MAIAFHPPEVSGQTSVAPQQPLTQNGPSGPPVVHQQFAVPGTGCFVYVTPSSAVIQHHQPTTVWVATTAPPPHTVVAQQQLLSGFPPIFHNNTTATLVAVPQFHRVASSPMPSRTPPAPHQRPQQHRATHRSGTTRSPGRCSTCNDDDVKRVYLLLSLMLSNLVYTALRGL